MKKLIKNLLVGLVAVTLLPVGCSKEDDSGLIDGGYTGTITIDIPDLDIDHRQYAGQSFSISQSKLISPKTTPIAFTIELTGFTPCTDAPLTGSINSKLDGYGFTMMPAEAYMDAMVKYTFSLKGDNKQFTLNNNTSFHGFQGITNAVANTTIFQLYITGTVTGGGLSNAPCTIEINATKQ